MSTTPERPWLVPDPWEVEEDERRAAELRVYRTQWQARKRRADKINRWRGAIGTLHSLSCKVGGRHKANRNCSPIPVFAGEEES